MIFDYVLFLLNVTKQLQNTKAAIISIMLVKVSMVAKNVVMPGCI